MKRIIPFILTLALVVAMSATAFATETESGNSQEVLATYEEGKQDKTIINVDISWNQMSFTYKGASEPTWNAEEHRYVGNAEEAGWLEGKGTITIRNNSNAILQTLISYNQEPAYDTVFMSFTDTAPYIGSAYTDDRLDEAGEVKGTPCEITIKALPTGALDKETKVNTKIGTITITLKSEVEVYTMMDELNAKIEACNIADIANLDRGKPYFTSGTDINALYELVSEALGVYENPNEATANKNVAINKALTAIYSAIDIAQ